MSIFKHKGFANNSFFLGAILLKITLLSIAFLTCINLSAKEPADSVKRVNFAGIPIVNYNATTGFLMGALSQAYYQVNPTDTISPPSSTGVMGFYTTNDSYLLAVYQKLYFNKDRWRILMAGGTGNFNFQYWQELPYLGGVFIGFGTQVTFAVARIERKLYKQLYAGVIGQYSMTETGFDLPEWVPDSLKSEEVKMHNAGYLFNYDNREHQLNPCGGYNFEFKHLFYGDWLGSDYKFQKFDITYNHYYKIRNANNILATRVKGKISTGNVPFQGENIVGGDDLRGYSSGKYRNKQIYAMQAEYRWRFYKKFGMVGFFGLASAVKSIGEIPNEEILPGIGLGLRYLMIEKQRINIGIDIAKGKDDWGLYFRIGESFGN